MKIKGIEVKEGDYVRVKYKEQIIEGKLKIFNWLAKMLTFGCVFSININPPIDMKDLIFCRIKGLDSIELIKQPEPIIPEVVEPAKTILEAEAKCVPQKDQQTQ